MERFELISIQHLATRAVTLLADAAHARADQIALQNMYRLLEMYRFDAFVEDTTSGVFEHRLLKEALDAASASAFPGVSKDRVTELLDDLIAQFANGLVRDQGVVMQGKRFFEELAHACSSQKRRPVVPSCA